MNSATVYVLGPHSAIKLNSDEEVLIPRPGLQVRPGTHVLGPEAGRAIVRVVNTVWDVGMLTILASLAKLVTPLSTIYVTSLTAQAVEHLLGVAEFTFMWLPAAMLWECNPRRPKIAIVFNIRTQRPFHSLTLAYMLLRFSEQYTKESQYKRFDLVDLCYEFTDSGVHGALFYDTGLRHAYRLIGERASDMSDVQHAIYGDTDYAVSTWSEDLYQIAEYDIEGMMEPHFKRVQTLLERSRGIERI